MVLLNLLVAKSVIGIGIFGRADGHSVLAVFLLGGALLGAIGGALAVGRGPEPEPAAAP